MEQNMAISHYARTQRRGKDVRFPQVHYCNPPPPNTEEFLNLYQQEANSREYFVFFPLKKHFAILWQKQPWTENEVWKNVSLDKPIVSF